jgi:RimJ/RimL family protein N-acetyltransferase
MTRTIIETPRLRLRTWSDDDLAPFATLNADPRVMEHFAATMTTDESNAVAARFRDNIQSRGFGFWVVEIINGPAFAGMLGLSIPRFESHFTPCIEIGWRLAHEHWGKGYASEAARAALAFGFNQLALDEIVAFTIPANHRSQRVMQKIGMTRNPADDFEHPHLPEGHHIRPHVLYRLSKKDWQEQTRTGG